MLCYDDSKSVKNVQICKNGKLNTCWLLIIFTLEFSWISLKLGRVFFLHSSLIKECMFFAWISIHWEVVGIKITNLHTFCRQTNRRTGNELEERWRQQSLHRVSNNYQLFPQLYCRLYLYYNNYQQKHRRRFFSFNNILTLRHRLGVLVLTQETPRIFRRDQWVITNRGVGNKTLAS